MNAEPRPAARVRRVARDLSLIFCAALAAYLASLLLGARLGIWLVAVLPADSSLPLRLLLGTLVLDFSKAPPLLLLAWALRRALSLRPIVAALGLLGFTYGLELLTGLALGQVPPLAWPVLASRGLALALLVAALRWLLSRQAACSARPAGSNR